MREAQEYWSGWPIPSPVDLPNPGIKPGSPELQADSLPTELSGKPWASQSESEVAQLCLNLCDTMDCNLPVFSVHGIFQARILDWVAISYSRRCSWPRDWTSVSRIAGRHFTVWTTREVHQGIPPGHHRHYALIPLQIVWSLASHLGYLCFSFLMCEVSIWDGFNPKVLLFCARAQSCLTLCDPFCCSPPGSSGHGISQARILEWYFLLQGISAPRDPTHVSCISCTAGRFFTTEPLGKLVSCIEWG